MMKKVKSALTMIAGSVITFLNSYVFCGVVIAFMFYILWQWINLIWEVRQWLF